jgi:hypothetical protein
MVDHGLHHGVRLRATRAVAEAAVGEARGRLGRLLGRCPRIAANLAAAGAELLVIGRDEPLTAAPPFAPLAGTPTARRLEARARAYGGLQAVVSEEMLLRLPSARHADHRDVLAHEVAHTALTFGLDARLRDRLAARFRDSLAEGRWVGAYAATNAEEWFAELSMWWVGSRGDHGPLPAPPADGPEGLRAYDPASHTLVDAVWSGRAAPRPVRWTPLAPTSARRSGVGATPTVVVFANDGPRAVRRWWLDHRGDLVDYGLVGPGARVAQPTYATHAWVVEDPVAGRLGPYVARRGRGVITVAPGGG